MHYLFPLLLAASLAAQSSWLPRPTSPRPPGRYGHGLDYHAGNQRVCAYLGDAGGLAPIADLWQWDGGAWTNVPVTSPGILPGGFFWAPRDAATCFDGAGNLMLFGGARYSFIAHTSVEVDETWLLPASGIWVQQPTAVRPAARIDATMVSTPQGVVLFGGSVLGGWGAFADTWRWNGSWTNVSPAISPPPRYAHAMAFDSQRNVVVLFGGVTPSSGVHLTDTWEFDGTTWVQRATPQAPPARQHASMSFAAQPGRTVLFGGWSYGTGVRGDTWVWDGSTWQALSTAFSPPPRLSAGMTYDALRQRVFLFGGNGAGGRLDDSYDLDLQLPALVPASYTPFGAGCLPPSGPAPTLAAAANEVPRPGTTSHLVVGNLPTGTLTLPVFVLGTSNTFESTPPSHPLPFDLGFLGWPGCQQLVSHDVMVAAPTVTGQATHSITVPLTSSLFGFTFHAQAFVLYLPSGAAVSNALTGVVGV